MSAPTSEPWLPTKDCPTPSQGLCLIDLLVVSLGLGIGSNQYSACHQVDTQQILIEKLNGLI